MHEKLNIKQNNITLFYSNYFHYKCNLLMVMIAKVDSVDVKLEERKTSKNHCISFLGIQIITILVKKCVRWAWNILPYQKTRELSKTNIVISKLLNSQLEDRTPWLNMGQFEHQQ